MADRPQLTTGDNGLARFSSAAGEPAAADAACKLHGFALKSETR